MPALPFEPQYRFWNLVVSKGAGAVPLIGHSNGVTAAVPAPKLIVVPVADPGVVFVAAQTFPPWVAFAVLGSG